MEDYWEDWCFICKDGGHLMLCATMAAPKFIILDVWERTNPSSKAKRAGLVESICVPSALTDQSQLASHVLLCCTYALCGPCYISTTNVASELSLIKGKDKEGLCNKCLELVKLAEANSEYGPDGKGLDFDDRDTFECRFNECWEIIKENEGLTFDDVYSPNRDNHDDDDHVEVQKSILGKRKAEAEEFINSDNDDDEHIQFQKWILQKRQKVEAEFEV